MQGLSKPFPPFGSMLNQLLLAHVKLKYSLYVYCGVYAMAEARIANGSGMYGLALPYKVAASDFSWNVVKDLNVVLFNTGESDEIYLKETVLTLLREGAKLVCLFRGDQQPVEIYNR